MKKSIKTVLATALVFAMTSMAAFAADKMASVSSNATANTIKDDVDYSMDSKYYKDAKINNFLLNSKLGTMNDDERYNYNLTFAKQFDKLYLGTNYNGNLWGWANSKTTNDPNTKTEKIEKNDYCANNFNVLFGFNNMGITVGFKNTISSQSTQTKVDGNSIDTENENTDSIFGASWGGSFDLENFTLKPQVVIGGNLVRNRKVPNSNYAKRNTFLMGLGSDFVFTSNAGLISTVGINYALILPKTSYYASDDTLMSYKKTPSNFVNLSYLLNYSASEKAELGAKINLNNQFVTSETVIESNSETVEKSFNYILDSSIGLGVKYNTTPAFVINAGMLMKLPSVNYTSTISKAGKEDVTSKEFASQAKFSTDLCAGFEWNITKGLTFDTSIDLPVSEYFVTEDNESNKQGSAFNKIFNSISIGLSYRK